jgi:hypothetical protein
VFVYYIMVINNQSSNYNNQDLNFYPVEVALDKPIKTLKQVEDIYPVVKKALAKEYEAFIDTMRNEYMEKFTGHKITPENFFENIQILTFTLLREE